MKVIQNSKLILNFATNSSQAFLKHFGLQSQENYVYEKNLKKFYMYLEDGASGCVSGDIEQVIFKKCYNYIELTIFYKNLMMTSSV